MRDRPEPPAPPHPWWTRLVTRLMPSAQRQAMLGDLQEEFARRARTDPAAARAWYRGQLMRSVVPAMRSTTEALFRRRRPFRSRDGGVAAWAADLRLAGRVLGRRPGFAVMVVGTLAMGIGATTALFSVYRSVFLEPLALPDADELVLVMQAQGSGCCGPASGPDYLDWVERNRSFEHLAALRPSWVNVTGGERAERIFAVGVTPNVFELLEVAPQIGRTITDDDLAAANTVVLSHELWRRTYDQRPDVVGGSIAIDGVPHTIVGVMPQGFDVPSPWFRTTRHELFTPFVIDVPRWERGNRSFPVLGRLSDGVSVESAQADMNRVMRELGAEHPATNADRAARVFTVHDYLFDDAGRQLGLILAAAALVLLIACANVAALQLARATARGAELSVRAALGASRAALVRLLFSESVVLAFLGGGLGLVVAWGAVEGLRVVLPPTMPRVDQAQMGWSALFFAVATSGVVAVAFGMLPAVLSSRAEASSPRGGGRNSGSVQRERTRDLFIVGQIAVGLVLANAAMLLVRSYHVLRAQDYGFTIDGIATIAVSPAGPSYSDQPDRHTYFEALTRRLAEVPGVTGAGVISRLPLYGGTNGRVQVEDREPRATRAEGPLVEVTSVVGPYFEVMGIPVLLGRTLIESDSTSEALGVVINQAMAREVWPGEDPLGKRFGFGEPPPWLTVVGVVGDVRQWGPEFEPVGQVYLPFSRGWSASGTLVAAWRGSADEVLPELRRAVLEVDPTQPPAQVIRMSDQVDRHFAERRFYTTLIGLFAAAALFLAAAGVYGTISYFVARRVREIGIRVALGAGDVGILRLVVGRGVRLVALGLGAGVIGVWAGAVVIEALVYGVPLRDWVTLLGAAATLALTALLASVLPALRALRVPPVLVLRAE